MGWVGLRLLGRGERANEIKCQKYVSLAAVANQTTNKPKDNGRPRTHARSTGAA